LYFNRLHHLAMRRHNSEMDKVDCIVIGAGVVGLAVAARLAEAGSEVLVLERGGEIGQGISSRNSEVIHAGIYYPRGSLKARLCVDGKQRLYEYCEQRSVPHRRTGKLIVATTVDEAQTLDNILQRAVDNEVTDLTPLDQAAIHQLEPSVAGVAGLLSPSTGIISAHEFMLSLAGDVTNQGGQVAFFAEVTKVTGDSGDLRVHCQIDGSDYCISTRTLINAAGLHAQSVADSCDFLPADYVVPQLHLCRGVYFSYAGKSPFQRLIYPVPEQNSVGLGIHATIDLGNQVKFGPDTEYIDQETYHVPTAVPEVYLEAIKRYFPALDPSRLSPGYAGIRPKLSGPDEPARDFVIDGAEQHGIEGFVQLFGIESPGLTASLAIGEYVYEHLDTIKA
jgi:L-2-hydroxyglutarate oxidase LhgO